MKTHKNESEDRYQCRAIKIERDELLKQIRANQRKIARMTKEAQQARKLLVAARKAARKSVGTNLPLVDDNRRKGEQP